MSLKLGSTSIGSLYLGSTKVGEAYLGSTKVYASIDPYNPLGLPPFTIRLKFSDGVTPSFSKGTGVQVSSSPNVWDLTYNNTNWKSLIESNSSLIEVLGANSTGVYYMDNMFNYCTSLTTVPLFDTGNVYSMSYMLSHTSLTTVPLFDTRLVTKMDNMFTYCRSLTTVPLFNTSNLGDMSYMFKNCSSLTTVPLFDTGNVSDMTGTFSGCVSLTTIPLFNTSNVSNMQSMFYNCRAIQSGALALYQQASTQTSVPGHNTSTFANCGSDTTTGAAELAQIPTSWGGTMS